MSSGWWSTTKAKLESAVEEFGPVVMVVYLSLFGATLLGFWVAIGMGFTVDGAAAVSGRLGLAYLATKATQPVRIMATLVVTPLLVKLRRKAPASDEAG
jgi:hypothetical protein